MLSKQRIQEIKDSLGASSDGIWTYNPINSHVLAGGGYPVCQTGNRYEDYHNHRGNGRFIAHAHQDIPALLAEREELIAAVKALGIFVSLSAMANTLQTGQILVDAIEALKVARRYITDQDVDRVIDQGIQEYEAEERILGNHDDPLQFIIDDIVDARPDQEGDHE